MAWYDLFFGKRGISETTTQGDIIEEVGSIKENKINDTISEVRISEDVSNNFLGGNVESIQYPKVNEGAVTFSPSEIKNFLGAGDEDGINTLLSALRSTDIGLESLFIENEEMSRDSVIGSAIETMADDACQRDETTGKSVTINSPDEDLKKFLEGFLENTIRIDERIWTWAYEIIKHGDLKLRRCEYNANGDINSVRAVYYEDVINPYLVSRIEYMGNILGFEDSEADLGNYSYYNKSGNVVGRNGGSMTGTSRFENEDAFIHFLSSKLARREKISLSVRRGEEVEQVSCYRVVGTSLVDNVRQIFRIMMMLDNMLVLSRIARSTQFNLVKIEVGEANPGKTQQILSDVRRRFEGNTSLRKDLGFRTDPSPVPINSYLYIPTRDGKGDVTVDSVGDSVDISSIVDIDYFTDKEFAALKVPKQYLGFAESLGSLGTNSLVKMDLRYARSVQRVQHILINGITALCKNYLQFRGRIEDMEKFTVEMRPLPTSETASRIEEVSTNLQMVDSSSQFLEANADYIDKAKWLITMLNLIDIDPTVVGTEKFKQIINDIDSGTYDESKYKEVKKDEEDDKEW
nr:MAG TPA: capsid assembly protein [Bacteriophage sp.]